MIDIENYQKEKMTIDLAWANAFGILIIIPILLVFGLPYYLTWGDDFRIDDLKSFFEIAKLKEMVANSAQQFPNGSLKVFAAVVIGIIFHELIHGITWSLFAKRGFKSIKFGILWKMVSPYCHCQDPLKVSQYIIGAIMPAIILGIIPSIVSIVIGNVSLLLFGMVFTMAACADYLIVNLLKKEKGDDLVLDHPSEPGCFVYRKVGM
jgi:Putative zincin peptidase